MGFKGSTVYSHVFVMVKEIIKGFSLKTERVKVKSYDINLLLEGHCTLNMGSLRVKALHSLSYLLKFTICLFQG